MTVNFPGNLKFVDWIRIASNVNIMSFNFGLYIRPLCVCVTLTGSQQ